MPPQSPRITVSRPLIGGNRGAALGKCHFTTAARTGPGGVISNIRHSGGGGAGGGGAVRSCVRTRPLPSRLRWVQLQSIPCVGSNGINERGKRAAGRSFCQLLFHAWMPVHIWKRGGVGGGAETAYCDAALQMWAGRRAERRSVSPSGPLNKAFP